MIPDVTCSPQDILLYNPSFFLSGGAEQYAVRALLSGKGRPIVTTDLSDCWEIIENGVNGHMGKDLDSRDLIN